MYAPFPRASVTLKGPAHLGIACSLADMGGPSASPGRQPGTGEASASRYACTPPVSLILQL